MLDTVRRLTSQHQLTWGILVAGGLGCQFDSGGTGQSVASAGRSAMGGQGNTAGRTAIASGGLSVGGASSEVSLGAGQTNWSDGGDVVGGSTQKTSSSGGPATGGFPIGGRATAGSASIGTGGIGAASSIDGGAAGLASTCVTDHDCTAAARHCLADAARCVQCLHNTDCVPGSNCQDSTCAPRIACRAAADCTGILSSCDQSRGYCVECASSADCPAANDCIENRCQPYEACSLELATCAAGTVCSPKLLRCVECYQDSNCGSSSKTCLNNVCRTRCTSDANCAASGQKCDTLSGVCVNCARAADCLADEFCSQGSCVIDRCTAGESRCSSATGLQSCNSAGDGYATAVACATGQSCVAESGKATCTDLGSGGTSSAGGMSGVAGRVGTSRGGNANRGGASGAGGRNVGVAGSGGTIATSAPGGAAGAPDPVNGGAAGANATGGASGSASIACDLPGASPCTSIPRFSGTQIVDGNGDEFCTVPSFELNFANATKVVEYNGTYGPARYPERAVVRLAWSPYFVRAFIYVFDPFVVGASSLDYIWGADSIELMISATGVLNGYTAANSVAMRIIAAPWEGSTTGKAAFAYSTATGTTYSTLAATEAVVRQTTDGYSVELAVPWPNAKAISVGSQIHFDFAINAAVDGLTTGANVRDAQAIYFQGAAPAVSTCGYDVEPYCDSRVWCQTLLK